MDRERRLRVVLVYRGTVVEDRVMPPGAPVTVGPTPEATLVTPPTDLPPGAPFLQPAGVGYHVALGPRMSGLLGIRGHETPVRDEYARRIAEDHGDGVRWVPLGPTDFGCVALDRGEELAVYFQQVTLAPPLPRPRPYDPLFLQALLLSLLVTVGVVVTALVAAPAAAVAELDVRPARLARHSVTQPPPVKDPTRRQEQQGAAIEELRAPRPRRLTRAEPRDRQDPLTRSVSHRGALGAMERLARRDSALRSLFHRDAAGELTRSLDALMDHTQGSVAGGSGGTDPGETGPTPGAGGGTTGLTFGRTHGGGRIDTRAASRVKAQLHGTKARRVSVSVSPGSPSVEGGLTRRQIQRVVNAHRGGVKYCYEAELARSPSLGGKIVVTWRIDLSGQVVSTRISQSTMKSPPVEACLMRQIRRWRFPKPAGTMVEVSYPFLFRSGL